MINKNHYQDVKSRNLKIWKTGMIPDQHKTALIHPLSVEIKLNPHTE